MIGRFFHERRSIAACVLLTFCACGGGGGGGVKLGTNTAPARLLLADSFEESSVNPLWVLNTLSSNYSGSGGSPFIHSPDHDGGTALRYSILRGQNEVSPVVLNADKAHLSAIVGAPEAEEAYFEWHEYFEQEYAFPDGSQKLLRFGFDDPEQTSSKKEVGVGIQSQNSDLNIQYFCGQWGDSSSCDVGNALHSNRAIPTGRWVKLGFWVRLNTPGESDGLLQLFVDGELLLDGRDLDLRGSDDHGFNFMWLGGNVSVVSGHGIERSSSRYLDNVRWYSTKP